jgi:hypothetical protein
LNEDVTFEGFAQIGSVSGKSPDISVTINNIQFREPSSSASAFAIRLGAGFEFQRRLILDVNFMNGTPEYTITATGGGATITGRSSQHTALFVLSLGLRLW